MAIFLLKLLTVDCGMVLEQLFTTLTTVSHQSVPTTDKSTAGEMTGCAGLLSNSLPLLLKYIVLLKSYSVNSALFHHREMLSTWPW